MQVYIEYAFAENFLLDSMLLYLAFCFMRKKARVVPLTIAASAGAWFACIYALFSVPFVLTLIVKTLAGAAMCLIACAHIRERGEKRGKSERRKAIKGYFVYTAVFFALAAALCGIFYAIDYTGNKLKTWQIPVCVFFIAACQTTAKRIFSAKKISAFTRKCVLCSGKNSVRIVGFIDSGNRAKTADGAPVCFVDPQTAFALFDETAEVSDFCVNTVNGSKKIKIFSGSILIYEGNEAHRIEKVYFAPSAHIRGANYSALLPADCCFCESYDDRRKSEPRKGKSTEAQAAVCEEIAVAESIGGGADNKNEKKDGKRRRR